MTSPYMYSPPGFLEIPEIGDVEVFAEKDEIHLFHLCLPNHDIIAHAVSKDGLIWKELPDALHTGDPGSFDDDMLWTMSVLRYKNLYYMFYTALSKAEQGQIQRVGLATSNDLINWKKYPKNPIGEADPRWYETEPKRGMVSWRDPYPFIEKDTLYLLVCARKKEGPLFKRGCVGLMSLKNETNWTVEPPLYAPDHYMDWEVPVLLKLKGRYYLFGSIIETRCCHYRIADKFEGPYVTPLNDKILPPGNYANRVCKWNDKYLMFHWLEVNPDWNDRISRYRKLAPPKEIVVEEDGSLTLASFEGWTDKCKEKVSLFTQESLLYNKGSSDKKWKVKDGEIVCCSPHNMSTIFLGEEEENFILEGTLKVEEGIAAGVLFRAHYDTDEAMMLRLSLSEQKIQLIRITRETGRIKPGYPWINWKIIQSASASFQKKKEYKIRIIASHEYIEISLNGKVKLSTLSWVLKKGKIGMFAEYATASFKDFTLYRI